MLCIYQDEVRSARRRKARSDTDPDAILDEFWKESGSVFDDEPDADNWPDF
jgi:hypothetical protein